MFDFTPEELNLNRQGHLSARQREVLRMTARGVRASAGSGVWIILGFLFFGMCLILGLYLQNESTRAALFSDPRNLLWFPAIALAVGVMIVISLLLARWVSNKLLNAQLQVAEGKIRLDQEYSSNAGFMSYFVYVGKKKFSFADDMSEIFTMGEKYRVYYCKASAYELIMSFEKSNS
jgi:uncharacterized protein YneF (UPF0154 family)